MTTYATSATSNQNHPQFSRFRIPQMPPTYRHAAFHRILRGFKSHKPQPIPLIHINIIHFAKSNILFANSYFQPKIRIFNPPNHPTPSLFNITLNPSIFHHFQLHHTTNSTLIFATASGNPHRSLLFSHHKTIPSHKIRCDHLFLLSPLLPT